MNYFQQFYTVIKETIIIKDYNFKYDIKNESIKDIFNNYLLMLNDIYSDDDYILFNKLQILHNILKDQKTDINPNYYRLIKSFNYIPLIRLQNNPTWISINNLIMHKIYSNIQIENDYTRFDWIIPINEIELLYKLNDNNDYYSDTELED